MAVANKHYISMGLDVEPCEEVENESDEGVDSKLGRLLLSIQLVDTCQVNSTYNDIRHKENSF